MISACTRCAAFVWMSDVNELGCATAGIGKGRRGGIDAEEDALTRRGGGCVKRAKRLDAGLAVLLAEKYLQRMRYIRRELAPVPVCLSTFFLPPSEFARASHPTMSCSVPHPIASPPRNAALSCYWHANGNLVCNTQAPSDPASPTPMTPLPFTLNASRHPATLHSPGGRTGGCHGCEASTLETFANLRTANPDPHSTHSAMGTSVTAHPGNPLPASSSALTGPCPYAEFQTFGTRNPAPANNAAWYGKQAEPCCSTPCQSCTAAPPSFLSPPRDYTKQNPGRQ